MGNRSSYRHSRSEIAIRFPSARLVLTLLFFCGSVPVLPQSVQFLPEIDTYVNVNSFTRPYLEAKDDRDEGAQDQFSFGPSIQFYLKPLLKLKRITEFDLDNAKPRPLVLETGYRYIIAPHEPSTQRVEPVLTTHFPVRDGFLITDRNRADLDWKSGEFNWRYRNKLTLERTVALSSYHLIPYTAVEPYYVSQYNKWSTTSLYAGALFPIGKHVQFNFYYEHENNTGKRPNQPTNSIGLALELFYLSGLK